MPQVKFTRALNRYFPELSEFTSSEGSLLDLLLSLDKQYPGLTSYLIDEQKKLRAHVNIFLDGSISDRKDLQQNIKDCKEVYIIQALSGG